MLPQITAVKSKAASALSALSILAGTREVEIDLPILQTKATVIPIVGSEELKLMTMKASGSYFVKTFNKMLFEHITFSDLEFADVEDFQKHISPPDKSLLVYALLDATFTTLPEKRITCPGCGKADNHIHTPTDLLHADTITKQWSEKELPEDFLLTSEIIKGFKVSYSMPTEQDRLEIIETKENSELRDNIEEFDDVLNLIELFSIYIKKLEIKTIEDGEEKTLILTDKVNDIIPIIQGMPLDLQVKLLDDRTVHKLAEYKPNFYLNITCSNLGCELKKFKWDAVDPEQDFFRKTLSVYDR